MCVSVLVAESCPALCNPMDSGPWDFPGKNTKVSCHSLLWGIFLTQGSDPRSPALQADPLLSGHQESPERPRVFPTFAFLKETLNRAVLKPQEVRLSRGWVSGPSLLPVPPHCWSMPRCDQMAVCRGTRGFGGQQRTGGSKQDGVRLLSPARPSQPRKRLPHPPSQAGSHFLRDPRLLEIWESHGFG